MPEGKAKKVLSIVPFNPIYPPVNGGMQRCFHIIHQLAKCSELSIVINQDRKSFLAAVKQYPALKDVRVYSTQDSPKPNDLFSFLPQKLGIALRYRWYKKKVSGAADGNFLKYYPIVKQLVLQSKFDAIILESPTTLNAVSLIRQYDKKVKIIFDAHNVETNLATAFLAAGQGSQKKLLATEKTEKNLHKLVDAILVCSQKDAADFDRMNNGKLPICMIPNGVEIVEENYDNGVVAEKPANILFCGYLSTKPNREGLWWFYDQIWPGIRNQFPTLQLLVVGGGKLPEEMKMMYTDPSVIFTGAVEDVKIYYSQCVIAVVPLKTGSGTRLKILEAMNYGLPVVSTAQGAEGIEYRDGSNILIADDKMSFVLAVVNLLRDKVKRIFIRDQAKELVAERYDWEIIGKSLSSFVNR